MSRSENMSSTNLNSSGFKNREDLLRNHKNSDIIKVKASSASGNVGLLSEDGDHQYYSKGPEDEENDKFNTFMFYMHGIGLLLPWNAILAAMDFYT